MVFHHFSKHSTHAVCVELQFALVHVIGLLRLMIIRIEFLLYQVYPNYIIS